MQSGPIRPVETLGAALSNRMGPHVTVSGLSRQGVLWRGINLVDT